MTIQLANADMDWELKRCPHAPGYCLNPAACKWFGLYAERRITKARFLDGVMACCYRESDIGPQLMLDMPENGRSSRGDERG